MSSKPTQHSSKSGRHTTKANDDVYYTKYPEPMMPIEPKPETVSASFVSRMAPTTDGAGAPFVDQLVAHTVHQLPATMVKQVLAHKVNDKYLTLGAGSDLKKKPFEGPKRSKFRKHMSTRQRKANGLDVLGAEHCNYELYLPLHELWKQYIGGLMVGKPAERSSRLTRADWHGALLQVVKSCTPGLVGTTGIVLQETTNTFKIITAQNKYKTIPKAQTVFSMQLNDNLLATIYGNHILYKPGERSVRKFKAKQTIDIGD